MKHITYLRRANEAARAARASGNTPFGAVLVNGVGEVVMVQGNAEHDLNDATAHAEMTLASRASRTDHQPPTGDGAALRQRGDPAGH